jgi:hypothetical protein
LRAGVEEIFTPSPPHRLQIERHRLLESKNAQRLHNHIVAPWMLRHGIDKRAGKSDIALEVTSQAQHLGPDRVRIYVNLAFYSLALQHLDDARRVIRDWEARSQNKGGFWDIKYALAFLGSDSAAMEEQQKQLAVQHPYERHVYVSDTEAYGGHLGRARELIKALPENWINWPRHFRNGSRTTRRTR